jgi:hypothetical protein
MCARLAPLVPQIGNALFEVLMLCCQPRIVAAGQLAHDLRPANGEPVDLPFYLDQRWHIPENATVPLYIPANRCGETSTRESHQKAAESLPVLARFQRRPHLQELDGEQPEDESADVREERDAAARLRLSERRAAVQ